MNRITVITADRPGLIAELCDLLAERRVNVASVDGQVIGTDAILHLEVDELLGTIDILTRAGCYIMSEDVVTFHVEDVPGALARAARELSDGGIDIRMMHTVNRSAGYCMVAITTNDNARARLLLAGRA